MPLDPVAGWSGAIPSWALQLQDASFRGVPFAVRRGQIRRGRRTVTHEYPYKDDVWVEDLGRAARGISLRGYLVGDDWVDQQQAMMDAAEIAGPGELVHPMLGSVWVSFVEPPSFETSHEDGRVVEIDLAFLESLAPEYPNTEADTQGDVFEAAGVASDGADADFTSDLDPFQPLGAGTGTLAGTVPPSGGFAAIGALPSAAEPGGAPLFAGYARIFGTDAAGVGPALAALTAPVAVPLAGLGAAVRVAQGFTGQARALVGDAGALFNAARAIGAPFDRTYGRYAGTGLSTNGAIPAGLAPVDRELATVSQAVAAATATRAQLIAVGSATDRLFGLL